MITRLLGFCILVGCLGVVFQFEGASSLTGAFRLFHWPAMLLTGVGPLGLVISCCDTHILLRTIAFILGRSASGRRSRHDREAILLQKLGHRFYGEGPVIFENIKVKGLAKYLVKVFDRLAGRMPIQDIRTLLENERDREQNRLEQCINVVSLGVRLAPSVGMLGTILGMVQLLSTLEEPSQIGSHMSLALLTTFYGLFFSLALWTPQQQKLERVQEVELDGYNQAIRWLEFMEQRKPASYFTDSAGLPELKGAPPGGKSGKAGSQSGTKVA